MGKASQPGGVQRPDDLGSHARSAPDAFRHAVALMNGHVQELGLAPIPHTPPTPRPILRPEADVLIQSPEGVRAVDVKHARDGGRYPLARERAAVGRLPGGDAEVVRLPHVGCRQGQVLRPVAGGSCAQARAVVALCACLLH